MSQNETLLHSLWYYLQFHVTAVGLGMYYAQIGGTTVFEGYSVIKFL